MSTDVVKVTQEMLGDMEKAGAPEEAHYMSYDIGSLAAYADIDFDWKMARTDESYIANTARECTQHFINKLFTLPSEPSQETGRLITIPESTVVLPREKPAPVAKTLTKWEKFAKQKGILKRKRSTKVWDEDSGTWKHSWGNDKANDMNKAWVIDHNENSESLIDPFSDMKAKKKARVEKQNKQQIANVRRAAEGSKKNVPGALDLASVMGKAKPGKRNSLHKNKKGKDHLDIALSIAQTSTNSMGKFDQLRKGEPKIKGPKKVSNMAALQKYENEQTQSSKVLKKVLGKVTEKNALNLDRAMHSVNATNMRSGEFKTAKGQLAKAKFKTKIAIAGKKKKPVEKSKGKNNKK